jgi:transcriptional regulator with XRE-family HTH domain
MGNDNTEGSVMEYSEIYAKRIRKLCKDRGIAINKLAVMSDVKHSTPDNIVRGLTKNPRVKTLHKVAPGIQHDSG